VTVRMCGSAIEKKTQHSEALLVADSLSKSGLHPSIGEEP
jgi:hypothetical protein